MRNLHKSFYLVMAAIFLCSSAYALDAKPSKVRSYSAVFASGGESVDIKVIEGQTFIAENEELGLSYTLKFDYLDEDRVQLTVGTYSGPGSDELVALDTVDLALDGRLTEAGSAPFSLAINGMTVESRASTPAERAIDGGGSCCVSCGGWTVCCTPAPGWCCEISSSCGSGCSACGGISQQ